MNALANTQFGVTLSLTVVKDNRVMTLPLANLTPLLFWLWALWQGVNGLVTFAAVRAARLVFTIECNLRRFKLGYVRLLAWLLQPAYMPVGVG